MYKNFQYLEIGDVIRVISTNPNMGNCSSGYEYVKLMVGLEFTVLEINDSCDLPNPRLNCKQYTPGYLLFSEEFMWGHSGNNQNKSVCRGKHCYWVNDGYCDIEVVTNRLDTEMVFNDLFESEIIKHPLLDKLIIFNNTSTKDDIKFLLNYFKNEMGAPRDIGSEWGSGDINIVYDDYIKKGTPLGIGLRDYDRITWGRLSNNSDMEQLRFEEFVESVNGFNTEKMFDNLHESEDDLDWAKETIKNEKFKFSDIISELNEGDIIEITGDITTDEGEVLVELLNEPFKIKRISGGKTEIVWLNNEDDRPNNWDEPSYGGHEKFIVIQPVMYPDDANLDVKVIEKTEHPF